MSTELVMPSNHLILWCPLLFLPSIFHSIRVFSNESALCIRWPKYWSFGFNISPSNEHPGLISFKMDWLDLLAVQGPLKSFLKHHSSKASILRCSAFFIVQLLGFPGGSKFKRICLQCRRPEFDPWVWKSHCTGNGNPLQYSCLEIPRDKGAWWAAVYGVAQSRP